MSDYKIGKLKGECVLVYRDAGGNRHRYRLGTSNARQAELFAPTIYAELTKPKGKLVSDLWNAFIREKADRAIVATMQHTWKALRPRFGSLPGDGITEADCQAHIKERRERGIKDWTIYTELGHLRMVLNWSVKKELLAKASHIERPKKPEPKEDHLTRDEVKKLIRAANFPHIKLYTILAMATGGRTSALLDLKWERCDFERELIDLRNSEITRPHKGRAIVPMNRSLKAALLEANQGALSAYVIEWAGKKVGSVKKALHAAGAKAKLQHVSPHMLRHSAAVHMAEAGITMEEIAQFLGHSSVEVTRKVYARFSPTYLRKAASVLEYDDLGSTNQGALPKSLVSA